MTTLSPLNDFAPMLLSRSLSPHLSPHSSQQHLSPHLKLHRPGVNYKHPFCRPMRHHHHHHHRHHQQQHDFGQLRSQLRDHLQ